MKLFSEKLSLYVESAHLGILSCIAEFLFDSEELIVLRNTLGTAGSAGLDLAGVESNSEVSDGGISCLTGTV